MMPRHPETDQRKCNWKTDYATELYGGKPEFRRNNPRWNECMAKAEEASKSINWIIPKDNVFQMPKREPTFANVVEWKETTSKGRVRDQKVVKDIQGQYKECCIVGCHYKHYDVAHIWALKHGSDDLPNNCWPMCPNHHREFDKGRLDPIFGDEPGNIKLVHEIDFENVTKALAALNEENSSQQGVK
jgi:predicted restriction endonuclease